MVGASLKAFVRSFRFAVAGITHTVRSQRNMRVHLLAGAIVAVVGIWLGLSAIEWAIVALTIGMVFAAETMNTVAESIVDLASPGYHPLAKIAKDAAAGAVLLTALAGIGVGAAIFLPHLWALWAR
ncbi:MAG: diacylglycerol kinase family protein [Chloroflexi bacterium]|nr:diacylglycerol kinase family protein [Chloroflexota bacterium]